METSIEKLMKIQYDLAKTLDFWKNEFRQTIEIKCLFKSLREINEDLYCCLEEEFEEVDLMNLMKIQYDLAKSLDFWKNEFRQTIEIKCLFKSLREINDDLYYFLEEIFEEVA